MQTLNRLQVAVARLDLQLPPHLGPEDRLRLHQPRARLRLIKVEQYRHLLEVVQDRRLLPEAVQDRRLPEVAELDLAAAAVQRRLFLRPHNSQPSRWRSS